jgi:hypothetical protein
MAKCSRPDIRTRALILAAMVLTATTADGQSTRRGQGSQCARPDTTGSWYTSQRRSLDDSQHAWTDDPLRGTLLEAAGLKAAQALRPSEGWQLAGTDQPAQPGADSMLARLRSLTRGRGSVWPTRDVVGAAGVRAVSVLVQRDTALERAALHRMMEAGPDASVPADVAMIEDRVRLLSGRKQLYGTQLRAGSPGMPQPLAIEDSAHVDLRRDAAGLPPLAAAVCAAGGPR